MWGGGMWPRSRMTRGGVWLAVAGIMLRVARQAKARRLDAVRQSVW